MRIYRSKTSRERILSTYDALLENWGCPVDSRDIATRYGATRVNICGAESLPPLLLLHGVGDDSALMWFYNARELSACMRLYAVDTLGGPGRSVPSEAYNASFDDAVWLDDVLDGLGLARADIAGVSHGGYLAQMYAICRPERVGKIACISAAPPIHTGGSPMKTMMKVFLPEALFPTRVNAIRLLRKMSGDNAAAFTDEPLIFAHFTALLKGYNNMAMSYHKVSGFSEDDVASLRDRALYLIGEKDPFMILGGKAVLERMRICQRMRMQMRAYPTAGHGLNHELPREIEAELCSWFCDK